jgi:putative flippase GtrA
MRITLLYGLFAGLAIAVNIGSQALMLALYDGSYAIYPAMLFGTFTGLIFKYLLDKQFIFNFRSTSVTEDLSRFSLYSLTGVFTTLLFWVTELSFDLLFASPSARYVGAVIGLSAGYLIKYQLDKRYVFQTLLNETEVLATAPPVKGGSAG